MIEPVVVRAVGFRVTRRGKYRHFVTVYGITPVEMLHLVGHLNQSEKS